MTKSLLCVDTVIPKPVMNNAIRRSCVSVLTLIVNSKSDNFKQLKNIYAKEVEGKDVAQSSLDNAFLNFLIHCS